MRYVVLIALLVLCASSVPASASGVPDLHQTPHVYLIIGENTEITQVNKSNAPYLLGSLKPRAPG